MRVKPLVVAFVVLLHALSVTAASTTDQVAAKLAVVLERELVDDVPLRSESLRVLIKEFPNSQVVHWAQGDVLEEKTWHEYSNWSAEARDDPTLMEYRDRRDVAEASERFHRDMADWCRANGLPDQEQAHLWALLSQQSDDVAVRKRLGQVFVEGRWLSAEDHDRLQDLERRRRQNLTRWTKPARTFAARLSTESEPYSVVSGELLKLRDISAIDAFETELAPAAEPAAMAFVLWCHELPCVLTTQALARQSLISPWEIVRQSAVEALRDRRMEDFVPAILSVVSEPIESSVEIQGDCTLSHAPNRTF